MLGNERHTLPWIGSFKSTVDDWDIVNNDHGQHMEEEESLAEVFSKFSDERVSIALEGGPSKGKTSVLQQVCLDWGRGASYLQHFNLVILIDCANLQEKDLDKHIMKIYKAVKKEKLNLQKWEVQREPFLLVLDNLHKIR